MDVAKDVGRPPSSVRRIERSAGPQGTSHDRSHKTERGARERGEVSTLLGRMIQPGFPQGCKRMRYDGVPAPKTWAQVTPLMQAALAQVKGVVKGALKSIAPMTSRQRSQQRPGRAPCLCPDWHHELGIGQLWHPA
jgi:hypothetical protein